MATDIAHLPSDVIILLMQYLSARDLAALCCTCKVFRNLVSPDVAPHTGSQLIYGALGAGLWVEGIPQGESKTFLQRFKEFLPMGCGRKSPVRPHFIYLNSSRELIATSTRYNTIADRNWARRHFVARPLAQRWAGKFQPRLTINNSRLLLGAGNTVYSYEFRRSGPYSSPGVRHECTHTIGLLHPEHDISALVSVPDGGLDRTILVGYVNGSLEKVVLPTDNDSSSSVGGTENVPRERYSFHNGSPIESMSSSGTHVLSFASSGTAALLPFASEGSTPEVIDLGTQGWSCHLRMDASTPYAVFGTRDLQPLSVHPIHESRFAAQPMVYLASPSKAERVNAVFAVCAAPPACAWGASDQIIVSGWYDGNVRIFDLRSPVRTANSPKPSLSPVMSICDPWSLEPVYSLACGGGSASHITAGAARHSVLAFWDVRSPIKGWSVHAPGNDSSPVYSVVMDGSRVFGANESRGFVYDFGPDVTEDTYPHVDLEPSSTSRRAGRWRKSIDDIQKKAKIEGPGFYVTTYKHNKY